MPRVALSLTTPWPWAILHCGKRVENRLAWRSCSFRGPFALHASNPPGAVLTWWRRKQTDPDYEGTARQQEELHDIRDSVRDWVEWARLAGLDPPDSVTFRDLLSDAGHIVGTAEITGIVQPDGVVVESRDPLDVRRDLTESERRWWMGGFALLLSNVRKLPQPVPCKGALGFWRIPPSVRAAMEAQ